MAELSAYGHRANRNAELASVRDGEGEQTEALGKGLAAIAYALLEVAQAIRDTAESQR
jgi:hypothetical protein